MEKQRKTALASMASSIGRERVSGPYTGYDKYSNVDHTYWTCENCGAEATRKGALTGCC